MPEPTLRLDTATLSWKEIDDEIIALDLRGGTYYSVNASGVGLFRALAEGTTRSSLVATLAETYGLAADVAERDVDTFLAAWRDRGFLSEG